MKKCLILILTIISILGCTQEINTKPLPRNPIEMETFENGLKYIHIKSNGPNIYLNLTVNAGSINEEDDQLGLAHFVEHMAFNGSKNFSSNEIIDFYQSIGMNFGKGLNAGTSFDTTNYYIEIPNDKKEHLDTAFLFLHDIASNLTFDEEELDKERGVIREEHRWRTEGVNNQWENFKNVHFFESKRYTERNPIGNADIILNFPRQRIIDFYEKWYRPDLMTLIVMGNVSKEEIETTVNELFSTLQNPTEKAEKIDTSAKNKENIFIFQNKNQPNTIFDIIFKYNDSPLQTQNQYYDYLCETIVIQGLRQRIQEQLFQENNSILGITLINENITATNKLTAIEITSHKGKELDSLNQITQEILNIKKYGLTKAEIQHISSQILPNNTPNVANVIKLAVTDSPIMEYTSEKNLISQLVKKISEEDILNTAKKIFKDNGKSIIVACPDNIDINKKSIKKIWKKTKLSKEKENQENQFSEDNLVQVEEKGHIVKKEDISLTNNIKQYTLSNGVKVILKQVFNESKSIYFDFVRPGGLSIIDEKDLLSAKHATDYAKISGFENISAIKLEELKSNKGIYIESSILPYTDSIKGNVKTTEFDTLMQILHLMFTKPTFTDNAWNYLMATIETNLDSMEKDDAQRFFTQVNNEVFNHDIRQAIYFENYLSQLDKNTAEKVYKEKFTDASNYTLILVGDFIENQIIESLEKYIATLPTESKKLQEPIWQNDHSIDNTRLFMLEDGTNPQSLVGVSFISPLETLSTKNAIEEEFLFKYFAYLLDIKLYDIIREEKSGTYGVSVIPSMLTYPKRNYSLNIYFFCDPAKVNELAEEVINQLNKLKTDFVSNDDINTLVNNFNQENNISALKKNENFWINRIENCLLNNYSYDTILDISYIQNLITKEKIRELANMYLKNYVLGILKPENISK